MARWSFKHAFPGEISAGAQALSASGELAVIQPDSSAVCTYDVHSGRLVNCFLGHTGRIEEAVFCDERFLQTTSVTRIMQSLPSGAAPGGQREEDCEIMRQGDGSVRLWDTEFGCERLCLQFATGLAYAVISLAADLAIVYVPFQCQSCGGEVRFFRISTGEETDELQYHPLAGRRIFDVDADRRLLLSGGSCGFDFWSLDTYELVGRIDHGWLDWREPQEGIHWCLPARVSPLIDWKRGRLAIDFPHRPIEVWSLDTFRKISTLSAGGDDAQTLAFSLDGRWLLAGHLKRDELIVFDVDSGALVSTLQNMDGALNAEFSPDGNEVAVASDRDSIELCDTLTGEVTSRLKPPRTQSDSHSYTVCLGRRLGYSRDGQFLIGGRSEVHVWERS